MTIKRIIAVTFIFLLGCAGWVTLGSVSLVRSDSSNYSLQRSVEKLWGSRITQSSPSLTVSIPGTKRTRTLIPSNNVVDVNILLDQRKKGLIWYPTYQVDFSGTYTVSNSDAVKQNIRIHFPLPSEKATYDYFTFKVDGVDQEIELNTAEGVNQLLELAPGQTRTFTVNYLTRGLFEWHYNLTSNVGRVKGLALEITTNFDKVNYPEGSLSPMTAEMLETGRRLLWQADDLITRQNVGIVMPEKINPGPLSARMSFFAPVCLLFFFVLISALSVIKNINIHPIHYLFVTAGFFAFHLLFAYLVDLINVHLALFISSVVSVTLVIAYLAAALGQCFPWKIATIGQTFYLVLFSYTFFIEGMTGLAVTIGSILTLMVLMALTAKKDWSQVFSSAPKKLATEQ